MSRDDWTAVAELTQCSKLHGAQGPAPSIVEMVDAFRADIDSKLKEQQPDMVGFDVTSLIATLLLRLSEWESVAPVSTNASDVAHLIVLNRRLEEVTAQRDSAVQRVVQLSRRDEKPLSAELTRLLKRIQELWDPRSCTAIALDAEITAAIKVSEIAAPIKLESFPYLSAVCPKCNHGFSLDDSNGCLFALRVAKDAESNRVKALEERLQIDPGGSDRIDELSQALLEATAQRDSALAEVERLKVEEAAKPKRFPIMHSKKDWPHPISIPWSVAEWAYADYVSRYGRDQSLERLAKRGGFCPVEMDAHLPGWRKLCEEQDRTASMYGLLNEALAMLEAAKKQFAPTTTNSEADETIARIKLTLCKG